MNLLKDYQTWHNRKELENRAFDLLQKLDLISPLDKDTLGYNRLIKILDNTIKKLTETSQFNEEVIVLGAGISYALKERSIYETAISLTPLVLAKDANNWVDDYTNRAIEKFICRIKEHKLKIPQKLERGLYEHAKIEDTSLYQDISKLIQIVEEK